MVLGSAVVLAFLGFNWIIHPLLAIGVLFAVLLGRIIQGSLQPKETPLGGPTTSSNALLLHTIGAAVVSIGGLSLLGLPGIIPVMAATPVMSIFFGARFLDDLPRYGGLGVIFFANLIWPWTLILAYVVAYRFNATASKTNKGLMYAGIAYASAVLVTLGAYLVVLN